MIPQHSGGGADGSIITFKDVELQNGANTNLNGIIQALENLLSRSRSAGIDISAGDMWVLAHSSTTQTLIRRLFLQYPTCCCRRHR